MTDTMAFRRCTDPDLSDVLAKLEGETVDLLDHDGNVIGQAVVGQRIHTDAPRVDLHVDPDARVIGA